MRNFLLNVWVTTMSFMLMAFSCEKDTDLISYQNLPNEAQTFVSQYFSDVTVLKTEIESNGGYSVDLSNGTEIDFNSTGIWVKVDARDGQTLSNTEFIPQTIKTYLAEMYPDFPVNGIEKITTGYEIELVNSEKEVMFDLNGNYTGVKH